MRRPKGDVGGDASGYVREHGREKNLKKIFSLESNHSKKHTTKGKSRLEIGS